MHARAGRSAAARRLHLEGYRNPDGSVHQKAFAGQTFDRTVHKGDLTGIEILNRLSEQVWRRDVRRMEGIIHSMMPQERRKPELIKASRKRRIAAGAGVQVQDVNRLLNQFEQMQSMMKKMKGGGLMKMMKRMGGMKGLPGMPR